MTTVPSYLVGLVPDEIKSQFEAELPKIKEIMGIVGVPYNEETHVLLLGTFFAGYNKGMSHMMPVIQQLKEMVIDARKQKTV